MKYLETHYLDEEERNKCKEKGLFVYDLRGSDTGRDIACIEKSVLVNRIGCIVTNEEIPLGDKYPDNYKDYEEFTKDNLIVYSIDELLNIVPRNISDLDIVKFAHQFLKDNNYADYEIKYITRVKDEHENMYAVAMNGEEIIGFNPLIGEIDKLPEWDFTFDGQLFDDLEWNREILYMPLSCHYDIWSEVSSWYPDDIEHKEGLQEYLKYCIEKQVDISKVQEYLPKTPIKDILQYLEKEENKNITRQLNDNFTIINLGYRKEIPVALVEKETKYGKEYIIGFNYKIENNNIEWGYGYYYDKDKNKALKDFKKILSGGNLSDTFNKKKKRDKER